VVGADRGLLVSALARAGAVKSSDWGIAQVFLSKNLSGTPLAQFHAVGADRVMVSDHH